ncbi:MAG: GntR family transcriptional regulator [Clostridia bacterium]|nr:GntR family transcriptional regulator [Clostridia bacterium]
MRTREVKVLQVQAYTYIKDHIKNGSLVFNQIYSETGIAQEIGISRTPVRDAIHLLYQEGLVDIIPNKGFVLHKMTEKDVMETYEVRSAIESYCCSKLAAQPPETIKPLLRELQKSLEKQRQLFEDGCEVELFAEEDKNFHYLLVSSSANDAFMDIFSDYMYWIKRLACYSLSKEGRMQRTIEEHKGIVDAIRSGDAHSAYNAMQFHIHAPLDFNLESIYQQP